MKTRKRQSLICLISLCTLLLLNVYCVQAEDELSLNGELVSVDVFERIATVDVKTEGCQGISEFQVTDPAELEGLEEKTISFYIDSSSCKGNKVHTMHKVSILRSELR